MMKPLQVPGTSKIAIEARRKRKRLRALTGGKCFYCGSVTVHQGQSGDGRDWILGPRYQMVREHVLPTSRGGTDDRANHVPACAGCNSDKGPFTIDEFRLARALRTGDLNFRFTFEAPATRHRDWLCCHSAATQRGLILHNMPSAAAAYELKRRAPNGPIFQPRVRPLAP